MSVRLYACQNYSGSRVMLKFSFYSVRFSSLEFLDNAIFKSQVSEIGVFQYTSASGLKHVLISNDLNVVVQHLNKPR